MTADLNAAFQHAKTAKLGMHSGNFSIGALLNLIVLLFSR